jgi:pilus assembly protein CpaF
MGLHDRLKTSNGAGSATAEAFLAGGSGLEATQSSNAPDPYAELKTRIHHACIATLGAELFKREATGDLNERVTRAVTEQLVLDRTPLTREERRQIIREITDDILGYGPL